MRSTIWSEINKNGIETTAPTVMVKPSRYIGADMSSFRYTKRNVSMNPHKLPITNIKNKKTQLFKFENIFLMPEKPVVFGSWTFNLVKINKTIPQNRNKSWEIKGTR